MLIRPAARADLPFIHRIQQLAPEASQWDPQQYNILVALVDQVVGGFLVWRMVAPDEAELLNIAVDPAFRRKGVASRLLSGLLCPNIFLEVRESNRAARSLYRSSGYKECGLRSAYYENPSEAAVVMRLQS